MVGRTLGHYEIIEPLGAGGMGEVYRARDTKLDRDVAIKVLPEDLAKDPERLQRFEREAKAVASLNHPNIVTIHSVEEAPGPDGATVHFLTMELVEGQTLDRVIPPEGLPVDRFFATAAPLSDAIGSAHQNGITHRDLKPSNIMITADGRVKVLDFGLAKLAEPAMATDEEAATSATVGAAPITEEGKVMGTVAYMSPEQAEGRMVDSRSDIFSLGIILYEMATGDRPFTGDTKMSLISSIIKDTPTSVTEMKAELPNHLGRIIKHCLEKDPERRFQSAQDVRNELVGLREEIDSGELSSVQPGVSGVHDAGVATAPAPGAPTAPVPGAHEGAAAPPAGGLLHNKLVLGGIAAVAVIVLAWWALEFLGPDASTRPEGEAREEVVGLSPIADTRPSVAVLYFDNLTGDDSLDWLRGGLTDLLVTDLAQSPELRVLTTDALYEILDELDSLDAPVTSAAVVREVAARADVGHVVVGSFIRAGDTFRLSARLQDVESGNVASAETVEGIGEDSVFASVDSLTRRIKERLAVPITASPVVDRDLSEVTTSSMDAYRYYTDGVNLISQSRYEEAIPVFERALEIDPEFAMAFAKLSIAYDNLRDFDEARSWSEKAIEHADRLTERERLYIEGRYYSQDAETLPQSIEAYEAALALYPDDTASRNNLAIQYTNLERYDRAIVQYEELLRRGTPFLPAYSNTADVYVSNGECDKGFALMRDFLRSHPEYHFAYQELASIAMRCGRLEEAEAALDAYWESREAGAPRGPMDGLVLAYLHMLRDEFDLAAQAGEKMADSASPLVRLLAYPGVDALIRIYQGHGDESFRRFMETAESISVDSAALRTRVWLAIAGGRLKAGDPDAAVAAIETARQTARQVAADADLTAMAAVAHARAGRIVAARAAARQHDLISARLPGPDTERRRSLIAAELALALDDPDTAVQQLQNALALLRPGPATPPAAKFVRFAFPLALAHLQQGDSVEAAELFERIIESGAQRLHYPYQYVRSFYFLGKIAQNDGDAAAARRHYRRFLDYWGDGDIDPERVEEARAFIEGG